jgi:hypothetical protein
MEPVLDGGARPEIAVEVLQSGLERFPGDPVLLAGLVSVCAVQEDRHPGQLAGALREAEESDPENAAWTYLRAMRAFRDGKDEEGLKALRAATERPRVSFHTFLRAQNVFSRLRELGYGELRARVCCLRVLSEPLYFDLKLLANYAIKRSHEYLITRPPEDLDVVLHLPHVLDRQLSAAPHPNLGQKIRWTILLNGLTRLADYHDRRDPNREQSTALRARAAEVEAKLEAIEAGAEVCGGREAWSTLYRLLGEERFARYVDGVLFGNEAEFLTRCAGRARLEECLELTQEAYPFQ